MAERTITIGRRFGVQLRTAVGVARLAKLFDSQVTISTAKHADARSAYDVLMLGAQRGTEVIVHAEGPDAEIAAQQVAEYFSDGGGI